MSACAVCSQVEVTNNSPIPVYTTINRGGKEILAAIGRAYRRHDGSITIDLDALPVSGRLVIPATLVQ